MTHSIITLCDMSESDLNKLTKAQLVEAIKKDSWLPKHYKSQMDTLTKSIQNNESNERAACVMLAAFVGVPIIRNEYSGDIESKGMNILELAGLVAAKCAAK